MSDVKYLARFTDGPLAAIPGATIMLSGETYSWPLPQRLCSLSHLEHTSNVALWDETNPGDLPDVLTKSENVVVYEKVSESQLPDSVDGHEHVMRGAEYRVAS